MLEYLFSNDSKRLRYSFVLILLLLPAIFFGALFEGHYIEWRTHRIQTIIDHYGGPQWFVGKKILELGCGYGDIGAVFSALGAQVTCSDAREEYGTELLRRYPHLTFIRADLDHEWPYQDRFDLILHMGTLYHLSSASKTVILACQSADYVVLETEVCDSLDPHLVLYRTEDGFDQAINRIGCRASPAFLEDLFLKLGVKYEQLESPSADAHFHNYTMPITNSNTYRYGFRRMWFLDTRP